MDERVGGVLGVVGEEGVWTIERMGKRCTHSALMMVLTWALKFSGRDVGVGRWARIVAA
jgi:hypothetical protein